MKSKYYLLTIVILLGMMACRKAISIKPSINTLVSSQVFATPEQARSVLAAAYYALVNTPAGFASGQITYCSGLSGDEFVIYDDSYLAENELLQNTIQPTNPLITVNLWNSCFQTIYHVNSIIENVEKSTFADSVKNNLIGQAKFLRGFCNFYLVNDFGEIPIVKTSNWEKTRLLGRNSISEVYDFIVSDLLFAKSNLTTNYSKQGNDRIVANRKVAMALLSKVYLYLKQWQNAEAEATELIADKTTYSLEDVSRIYSPDSKEAIWQLKQNSLAENLFSSPEGSLFIPVLKNSNNPPRIYLQKGLLNSFEIGDLRKANWIDSTRVTSSGIVYYFPYKYKVGNSQIANKYQEYHTVFRLAEQYLIRAEARFELENLSGTIEDINIIRARAGLVPLIQSLDKATIKENIINERRIELFAEWGNRWFDLKRWKKTDEVLGALKDKSWQSTDALYPIPASEIMSDPNLVQNAGY